MAPEPVASMSSRDAGARRPVDPLVGAVYEQLRAIAHRQLRQERPDHTLQATALVHEAYLRLSRAGVAWSSPWAFCSAAAEAMRRILIEHARMRGRVKRGASARRLNFDLSHVADLGDEDSERILALDDAVRRLERADPRAASVVTLRFYAGLSIQQTARAMGLADRTVKRDWEFARAWIYETLTRHDREE